MVNEDFQRLKGQNYKERRTAGAVYFVGGPFSQWYLSPFRASPFPGFPDDSFNCCEQYMMGAKALLFQDGEVYEAIMRETNPREQKALGRKVRNFDPILWDLTCRELVFRGNLAKFGQDADLTEYLFSTKRRTIVEGAHYDKVWGVGLAWDDPAIEDRARWRGTNYLGQVLMRVRDSLSV